MSQLCPPPPHGHRRADPPGDAGFTLVEMIVALVLIGVVGTATALAVVGAQVTTDEQADRQAAGHQLTQLTDEARRAGGAALLADPPDPSTATVNGVTFTREWSVTACTQPALGGACQGGTPAAGVAGLARVVVTVRWTERGRTRSAQASILLGTRAADPVFPA